MGRVAVAQVLRVADAVIHEVTAATSLDHNERGWCENLRQTDQRISDGESTCIVVARSDNGLVGASVGDSRAWLLGSSGLMDLTRDQQRKPLLGSGETRPVGFRHPPTNDLLLVCTDGFCDYIKREALVKEVLWIDFAILARKLVEMVRLPSGELWDDIGIVACRPRRALPRRKRYEIVE